MRPRSLVAIIAAGLALTPVAARAEPITYAVSFIGSGYFGSTTFSHTAMTISVAADTSQIQLTLGYYGGNPRSETWALTQNDPATITINNIVYSLGNEPVSFTYYPTAPVHVNYGYISGAYIYPGFTYMLGYLPPTLLPLLDPQYSTDGSNVYLMNSVSGYSITSDPNLRLTFQAFDPTLVPEPNSILLFGAGALGCLALGYTLSPRRRRTRSRQMCALRVPTTKRLAGAAGYSPASAATAPLITTLAVCVALAACAPNTATPGDAAYRSPTQGDAAKKIPSGKLSPEEAHFGFE